MGPKTGSVGDTDLTTFTGFDVVSHDSVMKYKLHMFFCACCVHLIFRPLRSGLSPFTGVDIVFHEIQVLRFAEFRGRCLLIAANGHVWFLLILCARTLPLTLQVFTWY